MRAAGNEHRHDRLTAFKHGICQLVLRARQTHIRGIHALAAIHLQFRTDDCRAVRVKLRARKAA